MAQTYRKSTEFPKNIIRNLCEMNQRLFFATNYSGISIFNCNLAAQFNEILMNESPLISVIIPVYNTAQYLMDAVGSIMNQTIHDIEIIVVNDGSTDDSERIIHELKNNDERIQYYALPDNQGQSVARNEGIEHARGRYIYFMDSDDLLDANALETCYHRCVDKKLDFLFFDGESFCDNGQLGISWDYRRTERYDEDTVYDGITLFEEMLKHRTYRASPCLMLVSRTHLKKLQLSFYPGIIHEDELFTALLYMQSSRIGCLKQSFFKRRVRPQSIITRKYSIRNIRCYLTVINELFVFATRFGYVDLVRKYARYTLNPVFQTAYSLSFNERLKAFSLCLKKGYIQYLTVRTLGIFWFKKSLWQSNKINNK